MTWSCITRSWRPLRPPCSFQYTRDISTVESLLITRVFSSTHLLTCACFRSWPKGSECPEEQHSAKPDWIPVDLTILRSVLHCRSLCALTKVLSHLPGLHPKDISVVSIGTCVRPKTLKTGQGRQRDWGLMQVRRHHQDRLVA